jgi:hypothetical protein
VWQLTVGRYPILDIPYSTVSRYSPSRTLLTDLHAFTREYMRCGELDGGVEEIASDEWRVRFTCSCGAGIGGAVEEE